VPHRGDGGGWRPARRAIGRCCSRDRGDESGQVRGHRRLNGLDGALRRDDTRRRRAAEHDQSSEPSKTEGHEADDEDPRSGQMTNQAHRGRHTSSIGHRSSTVGCGTPSCGGVCIGARCAVDPRARRLGPGRERSRLQRDRTTIWRFEEGGRASCNRHLPQAGHPRSWRPTANWRAKVAIRNLEGRSEPGSHSTAS
jgi:hypothetical protein